MSASAEVLIDGANTTNPESGGVAFNGLPSVEAIGEFRLINNTSAAEYGRTGSGIESFVTRSGGNEFHGSALNAASWAGKAGSTAANPVFRKASFHGNNYGAVIGGPIYLPKKSSDPSAALIFHTFGGKDNATEVSTLLRYAGVDNNAGQRATKHRLAIRNGHRYESGGCTGSDCNRYAYGNRLENRDGEH